MSQPQQHYQARKVTKTNAAQRIKSKWREQTTKQRRNKQQCCPALDKRCENDNWQSFTRGQNKCTNTIPTKSEDECAEVDQNSDKLEGERREDKAQQIETNRQAEQEANNPIPREEIENRRS